MLVQYYRETDIEIDLSSVIIIGRYDLRGKVRVIFKLEIIIFSYREV